MEWLYIISLLICISYLVMIIVFVVGWERTNAFVPKGNEKLTSEISVVVPCHNEEKNIRKLIACMAQQSNQNFELILVNDHSSDATRSYIKTAQNHYPKIQLVDAVGYGKKNALREGIQQCKGELVVVTDADCMPSYHWLETIDCFQKKYRCDLIICPVKLSGGESLVSYLQVLEFTSLVASAAGAAGAGMPVLCNGANLAFRRTMWDECIPDLHEEEQSGDDIFLLESIKKRGGKIRFLKSESAFVTTRQADTLHELLQQRRRWSAKSRFYTDWQLIVTALIVFLICLLLLVLAGLSALSLERYYALFLCVFVFKYILDSIFLSSVKNFFQLDGIWVFSFFLSLVYPFYIVFVALSSLVYRPRSWK